MALIIRVKTNRDRVLEITNGKGVDLVLDPVGGSAFDAALDCIASEGRIVAIGAASGKIPEVSILKLLTRNCSVIGADFAIYTIRDAKIVQRSLTEVM